MVQNAIVCYKDKQNNLSNDIFISFFLYYDCFRSVVEHTIQGHPSTRSVER